MPLTKDASEFRVKRIKSKEAQVQTATLTPFEQLISACSDGNYQTLNTLLNEHPELKDSINHPDASSLHYTPLHYVCRSAQLPSTESMRLECARLLFQNGADPNIIATSDKGIKMSCLWSACWAGSTAITRILLEKLGDTASTTTIINTFYSAFPQTPFHAACLFGDQDLIALLLAHGADPIKRVGKELAISPKEYHTGSTPLELLKHRYGSKQDSAAIESIKTLLESAATIPPFELIDQTPSSYNMPALIHFTDNMSLLLSAIDQEHIHSAAALLMRLGGDTTATHDA